MKLYEGCNVIFSTYREAYNEFMLDNHPEYRALYINHTQWGRWTLDGPIPAFEVYRVNRKNGLDYPKHEAYPPRKDDDNVGD